MDQTAIKKSDVLILSSLTQAPTSEPDSMIGEFCVNAGKSRVRKCEGGGGGGVVERERG